MSSRAHVRPEDLALSGPEVWPRIVADDQVDLFIFRRPELAYLESLRRLRGRVPEDELRSDPHIAVRVERASYVDKRLIASGKSRSWCHYIHADPAEDVRTLLVEVRRELCRIMPREPDPDVCAQLAFFDLKWRKLNSFQTPWP